MCKDCNYVWGFNPYPSSGPSVRRAYIPNREWHQKWVLSADTVDKGLRFFCWVWAREVPVYEMMGDSPHCVAWKWEYYKTRPTMRTKAAMSNRLNGG
jgi:hypothetical protein